MKKIIAISIMMLLTALIISACTKTTQTTPTVQQQPVESGQSSDVTAAQDLPDENEFSQPSVDKLDSDFDLFNDW
ncbi:hypothetical protein J4232_00205 [Candidatus Woesearchaeota archaeon]|nr:hypothetical protein [Candidatus Woesearchaeota archaeon]